MIFILIFMGVCNMAWVFGKIFGKNELQRENDDTWNFIKQKKNKLKECEEWEQQTDERIQKQEEELPHLLEDIRQTNEAAARHRAEHPEQYGSDGKLLPERRVNFQLNAPRRPPADPFAGPSHKLSDGPVFGPL